MRDNDQSPGFSFDKTHVLLVNQKILGASLNKTRRNSNWEQRPLTPNQVIFPLSSLLFINALHLHKLSPMVHLKEGFKFEICFGTSLFLQDKT